jgi:hypothetical protein
MTGIDVAFEQNKCFAIPVLNFKSDNTSALERISTPPRSTENPARADSSSALSLQTLWHALSCRARTREALFRPCAERKGFIGTNYFANIWFATSI